MFYKKIDPRAITPTRCHPTDAGLDLYGVEEVRVQWAVVTEVHTGICVALDGYYSCGQIIGRSGLGKAGVIVLGGLIDSGYRGEIIVLLTKVTDDRKVVNIHYGKPVAQMIIHSVDYPTLIEKAPHLFDMQLAVTDRGTKGFGSSG